MKNLKRLLSLVVVMALLCALPLTVSAAGADNYTDSGDITYTEAVDVLTGKHAWPRLPCCGSISWVMPRPAIPTLPIVRPGTPLVKIMKEG